MSDTVLNRTHREIKAVRAEAFKNVPAPVVERMGTMARLGAWLVVLGVAAAIYVLHLAVTMKDPDWKLLGILLVVPVLLILFGGNLISTKVMAATLGSAGALWRGIKGQAPASGPPQA